MPFCGYVKLVPPIKKAEPPLIGNSAFYVKTVCIKPIPLKDEFCVVFYLPFLIDWFRSIAFPNLSTYIHISTYRLLSIGFNLLVFLKIGTRVHFHSFLQARPRRRLVPSSNGWPGYWWFQRLYLKNAILWTKRVRQSPPRYCARPWRHKPATDRFRNQSQHRNREVLLDSER